jgi:hypothetical protein
MLDKPQSLHDRRAVLGWVAGVFSSTVYRHYNTVIIPSASQLEIYFRAF